MQPFKLDVTIKPTGDLRHDVEQIKRVEQLGFDGIWINETAHNPFFLLTVAAKKTHRIHLGTADALAFPRSPMVTAQIAWDLARQCEDRFVLGLGIPAREDLERRFSENWSEPVARMREYSESLRAIWDTFQTGARLRYRGEHYQFRLMAPFFNPGPISHPAIPICLAGDGPGICQLAGELAQGLRAPPNPRPAYLREVVIPALENGLRAAGRARNDIAVTVPIFADSAKRGNVYNSIVERYAGVADRVSLAWIADDPALFEAIADSRAANI